jgi:hypothetical protein
MPTSVALLIDGSAKTATANFDRHDPVTGEPASHAAAAALPGWRVLGIAPWNAQPV